MPYQDYAFGYCTNVHAGATLEEAKANLQQVAGAVRQNLVPDGELPIGLWLPDCVASSLIEHGQVHEFARWLKEQGLVPYSFNGFPQGNFHQPIVKHAVYEPTWCCESRARYTMCLAEIMEAVLPRGQHGSISTLPLGWPHAPWHAENFKTAADNLLDVAKFLDRLNQKHGCEVVLALEPEPGCVLNTAAEVVDFFEHFLFSGRDAEVAQRYLTVCHDICHSGVMFESQTEALELYLSKGIRVGKVQVSSAVHVPWDAVDAQAADAAKQKLGMLEQLQGFCEPRYLHQTTSADSGQRKMRAMCEDLPQALAKWIAPGVYPSEPWRVHFHVPIYVAGFDYLDTTQADIREAVVCLEKHAEQLVGGVKWFTGHYEVETYAWPVLPPSLAASDLASGITRELQYFAGILDSSGADKAR